MILNIYVQNIIDVENNYKILIIKNECRYGIIIVKLFNLFNNLN